MNKIDIEAEEKVNEEINVKIISDRKITFFEIKGGEDEVSSPAVPDISSIWSSPILSAVWSSVSSPSPTAAPSVKGKETDEEGDEDET